MATALDHDDYEGAHGLLHREVVYEIGDESLYGPDAIVESYRSSSEMAHDLFDTVGYGHEIVETDSPTFTVRYRDVLTVDGETHTHFACQEITVSPDRVVTRIVDRPVPGERAKVDEFMARHNLTRPDR